MNALTDDIGLVVEAMKTETVVYYMYDHRLGINNRLLSQNNDEVLKFEKYPLVALRCDIEREVDKGLWNYKLNIAILAPTEKNYNAEESMVNVFKPVLYPLYELFMAKLRTIGIFQWAGNQIYPPQTVIDRIHYGTGNEEQNIKSYFSDTLDAIEILNLRISSRIKKC